MAQCAVGVGGCIGSAVCVTIEICVARVMGMGVGVWAGGVLPVKAHGFGRTGECAFGRFE